MIILMTLLVLGTLLCIAGIYLSTLHLLKNIASIKRYKRLTRECEDLTQKLRTVAARDEKGWPPPHSIDA